MASTNKPHSTKQVEDRLAGDEDWTIVAGRLTRPTGAPRKTQSLFKFVGEKIPYKFLGKVKAKLVKENISINGVYIAHDSMGYPRYIGRGSIFTRLTARKKAQRHEIVYFSFFVVDEKIHEREIETIMIRAAGPLLDFNSKKKRTDIHAGDARDFEPGTGFVERQYKKGKKPKTPVSKGKLAA